MHDATRARQEDQPHQPASQTPAREPVHDDIDRGDVNVSVPNVARIYDYLLGGKNNFAADRDAAAELARLLPEIVTTCEDNRQFLQRAVRYLADDAGIRQFIDVGTGLPTQGNVHEIAQSVQGGARVLYVDYDPVVVSHAQALLADNRTVVAINRDLRQPDQIVRHPATQALINFDEPIAVLLVAVLHFVRDHECPYHIVNQLKDALAPGSYLVISHATADGVTDGTAERARRLYDGASAPVIPRTRSDVEQFFNGFEILSPGVVTAPAWRSNWMPTGSNRTMAYAAVGRKP